MKNIAVILSGCGVKDGSEIHEATLLLLAIDKLGAKYTVFAANHIFIAASFSIHFPLLLYVSTHNGLHLPFFLHVFSRFLLLLPQLLRKLRGYTKIYKLFIYGKYVIIALTKCTFELSTCI